MLFNSRVEIHFQEVITSFQRLGLHYFFYRLVLYSNSKDQLLYIVIVCIKLIEYFIRTLNCW